MGKDKIVGFRLTAEQSERLSALAEQLKLTQSELLRALVEAAEIRVVQTVGPVATVQGREVSE